MAAKEPCSQPQIVRFCCCCCCCCIDSTRFKIRNTGKVIHRNGAEIVHKNLKNNIVDMKRFGDRIILLKCFLGDDVLQVISAYVTQVGLVDQTKREIYKT